MLDVCVCVCMRACLHVCVRACKRAAAHRASEKVQPLDARIRPQQEEEVNQVNFSPMLHYITLLYHHIFICDIQASVLSRNQEMLGNV
jgi:hypothetical protein